MAHRSNPHDKPLIDALRAWHRWEHGDQVGAMHDAEAGVEVPEEMIEVFEAQELAATAYEAMEEAAEDFGYDSPEFERRAALWAEAIRRLAETLEGPDEEPAPAPAARPGKQQTAARAKAAGMARQHFSTGPALSPKASPAAAPGGVVTGGQSLGNGFTMGPIDMSNVRGFSPMGS